MRIRTITAGLLALGVLTAGCTSPGTPENTLPTRRVEEVPASRVCGGTLLDTAAVSALERLTHSTAFDPEAVKKDHGAPEIARVMEAAFRSGDGVLNAPEDGCEISPVDSSSAFPTIVVAFIALGKAPAGTPTDEPNEMSTPGVLARASEDGAKIYFDCESRRLGTTEEHPLRLRSEVQNSVRERGEPAATRHDNLTLAHSAAVAVAKELGCAGNGGLPGTAAGLPVPGE
ncbi:hypothetical protein [Streptomyces sp. NRRL S-87]|uniref:hypothetical protein n=1 Tax=Streptomyces sp. NRRL S-87 TaxID=1463920 RepID=UPI0004C1ADB1|nr:hypothetical protein [Streptomyces sp. NRRL S-87]